MVFILIPITCPYSQGMRRTEGFFVKWLIAAMLLCLTLVGMVSGAEQAANNTSVCVGCSSDSANVTENQTATFIFIQEGTGGSFVNDGSGNYTLTMTDVVPYTIFFADLPARDVGFAPMDKFLKGFGFGAGNPPNAAIILPEENETSDQVIVELTNPQYDNATGMLTYTARLLQEYSFKSRWLEDQRSKVDVSIPERFGRVVLVIDSCPCWPTNPAVQCSNGVWVGCQHTCWETKDFRCRRCDGGCCGKTFFC
jgi:hypothetical protein